jgi:hypothetical protein
MAKGFCKNTGIVPAPLKCKKINQLLSGKKLKYFIA